MNGIDEGQMSPQTFLYGCVLESGKEVLFNPEDDDFEHQLDLRMACVDVNTKDELHIVEVEGQDPEGQKVTAVLVTLKPSALPSVCLGGFNITPPAVFRLKAGSGPIHISGQHLIMMGGDQSFDEDDDDVEEEEEEEVKSSKKRPAQMASKSSKKIKLVEADDDDDDDDEEDDEESEEEESPVKVKKAEKSPLKAKAATPKGKGTAQNGKSPKPSTPAAKTPKNKVRTPKPQTPSTPATFEGTKAKMLEVMKKGVGLPKAQLKFENFAKNGFKVADTKIVADLWKWRQTVTETVTVAK